KIKNSVKEAPEFFRKIKYQIGDYLFSPDDIEHGILRGNVRPYFRLARPFGPGDPRRAWILKPVGEDTVKLKFRTFTQSLIIHETAFGIIIMIAHTADGLHQFRSEFLGRGIRPFLTAVQNLAARKNLFH
ncbi:DUF547 domain-containing protein, partial [bacterium]|nr:DUF547 domain-containing protein [bacterium]